MARGKAKEMVPGPGFKSAPERGFRPNKDASPASAPPPPEKRLRRCLLVMLKDDGPIAIIRDYSVSAPAETILIDYAKRSMIPRDQLWLKHVEDTSYPFVHESVEEDDDDVC